MYILDQGQDLRSSPQPMIMDHDGALQVELSTKKRKRGGREDSGTISDSLTAISNYYSGNGSFLTPAPSSPSTFTDMQSFENQFSQSQPPASKQEPHVSKRIHLSPKSRRPPTPASQLSHEYFSHPSMKPTTSACHLCHRRPATTAELAAFMDCDLCRERTCYVCRRTCEGPGCQSPNEATIGRNVCGKCCVEVGVDGRVWCLACYEDEENGESYRIGPSKKELQNDSAGRIAAWLDHCGASEPNEY